ncbi:Gfo/Idh/MocA family protein [Aspergillus lucknowensis]|uniref:NAD(P)-binding protein n=1 Tax=Aspergillus lucknowensis TaxID=176173 RepID=A0ABR4M1U8_9EURO
MNKIKSLLNYTPSSSGNNNKPSIVRPANSARLLLIGAGSRGGMLAAAINDGTNGFLVSVADPDPRRRREIGRRFIWKREQPRQGQEFGGWREFLEWEVKRRERLQAKKKAETKADEDGIDAEQPTPEKGLDDIVIDAVVICTADRTHREIVTALAPLGIHIMCEKPLATSLDDCLEISRGLGVSLQPGDSGVYSGLFGIGHVMRYAPINQMIRKLVCEDDAVGDIVSIEHTENVGWWHFAHSYVRGNWRNEDTSGPSLLTKSCHDIDFLMWLLSAPTPRKPPHIPATVAAFGSLRHFRRARKPVAAGTATNCLHCPAENECQFSAKKIYLENSLRAGLGGWPANVVVPEIEDLFDEGGLKRGEEVLMDRLEEDYTVETAKEVVDQRQWYGRCVYEADNNVCDDQTVHISWDDDSIVIDGETVERPAKSATFHMTAFADGVCIKRTKIFGTKGEIESNGRTVRVVDFRTGKAEEKRPHVSFGGHSGGDHGLMRQFVYAVNAVKNDGMDVQEAQRKFIGCSIEDVIRSHAMVFAAEEARKGRSIVDWNEWWNAHVRD